MTETDLIRAILLAATQHGARLFRNNTAVGWVGQEIRFTKPCYFEAAPGDLLLRRARPLRAGLIIGSSDLIGWTEGGRFLAVEAKFGTTRTTKAQRNFIEQVNQAGGRAGIVRSVQEAVELITDQAGVEHGGQEDDRFRSTGK